MVARNKAWFTKRHPKTKTKAELIDAVVSDPAIKSDHILLVDSFVDQKRSGAAGGMYQIAWQPLL